MKIGYRDHKRTVELDAPLTTAVIGQIVRGDANADRFVLELKNGGKPADLDGYSADGLFINRFGMEVPLRATVSGSEIEMVLTGGCYDVGGAAVGHVRLISSDASQIRTVIRFVADVTRDGSGVAYDPDGVIKDIDTLLAKLTAMENATKDGLAAAQEARNAAAEAVQIAEAAGTQAVSLAQAAGVQAIANANTAGAEAKATAETAAAKADAAREEIEGDLGAIKSELDVLKDTIDDLKVVNTVLEVKDWAQGSINASTGASNGVLNRCRTGGILVTSDMETLEFDGYSLFLFFYSDTPSTATYLKEFVAVDGEENGYKVNIGEYVGLYVRLAVHYADDRDIAPADVSGVKITKMTCTDITLTQSDKPADAKVTGDAIRKIEQSTMIYDGVTAEWELGGFNATGTKNATIKTNIRTKDLIVVPHDGTVKADDGYKIRVFWYADPYAGFTADNLVTKNDYTTNTVDLTAGDVIAVTVVDVDAATEKTDTSISKNVLFHVPGDPINERILKLEGKKKSPYYKGELAVNPCNLSGWYAAMHDDFTEKGFAQNTTYAQVIAAYDSLVDGEYVTKTALGEAEGNDSDGNPYILYEYAFVPKRRTNDLDKKVMPKILLDGGIHGFEKAIVFGTWFFCYDLVNNWDKSPLLEEIHDFVELRVIPIVSPSAFNISSYDNINGVNINRNFPCPPDGSLGTDESAGSSPLDQKESKILSDWLIANRDCLFYADCHTNGWQSSSYGTMNSCMGSSDRNDAQYNKIFSVFSRHITKQTVVWSNEYDNINPTKDQFVGGFLPSATANAKKGTVSAYANTVLGDIVGFTFESFNGLTLDGEKVISYSDNVRQLFKMNAENVGNLVAQMLCEYAE